jgi:hypothetical protein
MSYYDNVKDNVKDKKTNSAGAPSFDTLKEAAEETSVDEEEESDDGTPIEVLEEGGLRQETSSQQRNKQQNNSDSSNSQAASSPNTGQSADMSSIEQKLDKMIEQNQKIIEVLESFGQ